MSESPVQPNNSNPPALPEITIWSAETLREQLRAKEASSRLRALAMANQPKAPLDDCIPDVVACAELSSDDPIALRLAAVALGGANVARLQPPHFEFLSQLIAPVQDVQVRIFAAHSLFRLKHVPASAFAHLSDLLLHAEAPPRKVAALALSLSGNAAAGEIAKAMSSVSADKWSTEALSALAHSAMASAQSRSAVEQFVMRGVEGEPLVPTGIAAYAALAKLNPDGAALQALTRVAIEATDPIHWRAAIDTLSSLGENATGSSAALANALEKIDDPEREELLCQMLVQIKVRADDLPIQRMIHRIAKAPDRAAAAHCMLIALHAKKFLAISKVVHERFAGASDALARVLSKTHEALAGTPLERS